MGTREAYEVNSEVTKLQIKLQNTESCSCLIARHRKLRGLDCEDVPTTTPLGNNQGLVASKSSDLNCGCEVDRVQYGAWKSRGKCSWVITWGAFDFDNCPVVRIVE